MRGGGVVPPQITLPGNRSTPVPGKKEEKKTQGGKKKKPREKSFPKSWVKKETSHEGPETKDRSSKKKKRGDGSLQ